MIDRFVAIIALVCLSTFAFAEEVSVPELTGRAVFAGKVQPSNAQKENIVITLKELEKVNKVQMAVLVVDSVKPLAIEQYSMSVAEKWKLGRKGVDNGVLLVVATSDRKARIEVGRGLEGVLTDAMTKRIQSEKMIPYFKKGEFAEGISSVVTAIKITTTKEVPVIANAIEMQEKVDSSSSDSKVKVVLLIFGCIFGISGIFAFFIFRSSRSDSFSSGGGSFGGGGGFFGGGGGSFGGGGGSFGGGGGSFSGGGSSSDW